MAPEVAPARTPVHLATGGGPNHQEESSQRHQRRPGEKGPSVKEEEQGRERRRRERRVREADPPTAVLHERDQRSGRRRRRTGRSRSRMRRTEEVASTPFLEDREKLADLVNEQESEEQGKRRRMELEPRGDLHEVAGQVLDFFAEEYPGGYSAAQLARHVAIQVFKSGTPLGDCLSWSIQRPRESTSPPSGLLPLPQWFSAVKVLQRFEKLEFSWEGP